MGAAKFNPMLRFSLVWPDKTALSADTPEGLLDRIASLQWEQPCSRAQVRARLVDRAAAWAGINVNEETDDLTLLRNLAAAQMFVLFEPMPINPYITKEN